MTLALRTILTGAVLTVSATTMSPAHAQAAADARQQYDIAAGTLDQVLSQLGKHAGVMLAADASLTARQQSEGLRGDYTIRQALAAVLAPHGLEAIIGANGGYRVRRIGRQDDGSAAAPGIQALDAVQVFGTLEDNLSIGSKTGQSLRETPKSVTVVTRERLDAQNLTTLNGVMQQTTGVTINAYGPIDNFYFSRGFRVTTFQIDGGAPAATGVVGAIINPDMAIYDHLEMLRGVDGMYSGAGGPGGVINLVRKRPTADFQVKAAVSAGSWDSYRAEVDVSGPLTDDGRLRARGVVAYEDKHSFLEGYNPKKLIGYGVVEYDVTDRLLLTAGADLQNDDHQGDPGWAGHMRYSDGGSLGLGRETVFGTNWSNTEYDNREYFIKAEQKYGQTGVLRLNLTRIEQDYMYRGITVLGAVDRNTGLGPYYWTGGGNGNVVQNLFDLSAGGSFNLFGRDHRYAIGTDYGKISNNGLTEYQPTAASVASWPTSLDVFNWDRAAFTTPEWYRSGEYPSYYQTQKGFYGTLGLQLSDPLRLTVGGRYGEWKFHQASAYYAENGTPTSSAFVEYEDKTFIPSAALSYNLTDRWTAYLSYAETFEVQSRYLDANFNPLDPVTGSSWEFGIKGEPTRRLNAAFAIFEGQRDGQATRDPAYPLTPGSNGSNCCYLPSSNVVSRGADIELSGTLFPGLQLFAGYTFNTLKTEGAPGQVSGVRATPKHLLKVWGTWQLPGSYSDWTINGGVVARSEAFSRSNVFVNGAYETRDFYQAGMAIWNASVQYRINDAWTVGLYGENLGDKVYFSSLGSIYYENNYAAPSNYTMTLRGSW